MVRRYSDDRVVKEFRSDEDGSFRVGLAPGRYVVEGKREQSVGGILRPTYVSVQKDRLGYRQIVYESP